MPMQFQSQAAYDGFYAQSQMNPFNLFMDIPSTGASAAVTPMQCMSPSDELAWSDAAAYSFGVELNPERTESAAAPVEILAQPSQEDEEEQTRKVVKVRPAPAVSTVQATSPERSLSLSAPLSPTAARVEEGECLVRFSLIKLMMKDWTSCYWRMENHTLNLYANRDAYTYVRFIKSDACVQS
jgi:hypothetical protein